LLPVDQIEPAFNPLVPICTELPTGRGNVDCLLVTPAGDLALIEGKLWRNSEARREVVAQIIDYAREMSGWSFETFQKPIRKAKPLNGSGSKQDSLFELVSAAGEADEVSFQDAV